MFDSMFVSVLCDIATDDYLQQRPYHTNGSLQSMIALFMIIIARL